MLSYRHAFHAGNHADLLKHLILIQIAEYMGEKPAPFWIIDTHAGAGRYALESAHASKLGEYRDGVGRLWDKKGLPPAAVDYLEFVKMLNPDGQLRHYPGSPWLASMPKKAVMMWVDMLRALLTLLIPTLYALDSLSITGLYGLIFLTSVVSTVFGPALVSAVPLLVRPSELMSANALIQGTNNIGMLLGPAISGIMIALINAENVLFVNSATFLISALCLMPMHVTAPLARPKDLSTSIWQELTVGFQFVFGQQSMVLTLVIISSLYNLGVSAFIFILPVRELRAGRICVLDKTLSGWTIRAGAYVKQSWRDIEGEAQRNKLRTGLADGWLASRVISVLAAKRPSGYRNRIVNASALWIDPRARQATRASSDSHGRFPTTDLRATNSMRLSKTTIDCVLATRDPHEVARQIGTARIGSTHTPRAANCGPKTVRTVAGAAAARRAKVSKEKSHL